MSKFVVDQRSFDLVKELLAAKLPSRKISMAMGCSTGVISRINHTDSYATYATARDAWRRKAFADRHQQAGPTVEEVEESTRPQQPAEVINNDLPRLGELMSSLKVNLVDIAVVLERLGY